VQWRPYCRIGGRDRHIADVGTPPAPAWPGPECYTGRVFATPVPEITVGELTDDAYLLDVREDEEWAAGHAPAAHHLPMMDIPVRLDEVPRDQDVVVVCRVGARSAQVVAYLRSNGWQRVANLAGGMCAWAAAGRPLDGEDGREARVL
jgi:rhodanese-related sulfurtransferase